MARRSAARRASPVCLPESFLRPRRRLVIATGEEMTGANQGKCERSQRIERAEADGTRCPFDFHLGLAQPSVDPTAQKPARGQIRIEAESLVDEGGSIFNLAHHECEREPAHAEGDRVLLAQL